MEATVKMTKDEREAEARAVEQKCHDDLCRLEKRWLKAHHIEQVAYEMKANAYDCWQVACRSLAEIQKEPKE